MGKRHFIRVFVECVFEILLLHLMYGELPVKCGGINYDFVMKSICSVQKLPNHLNNAQLFRMSSTDVHRLQAIFLFVLKNFVADSMNLEALIGRFVQR